MVKVISYLKLLVNYIVGELIESVRMISAREIKPCECAEEEANGGNLDVVPKSSEDFNLSSKGQDGNQGWNRESIGVAQCTRKEEINRNTLA